jgi:hypothetical protein
MRNIYVVPKELIQQAWSKAGHLIHAAMEYSGDGLTTDQVKVYLSLGSYQLLLFIEDEEIVGAVCFRWVDSPNDRTFFVVGLGGKTTKEHAEMMFEYARQNGGTSCKGAARESVARLWRMKYGFNEIYRVVEKKL